MTKSTITREQLEEWVAQFDEDGGCDATDRQLEALIRQSLAAMNGEPVAYMYDGEDGTEYNGHNEFSGGGKGIPLYLQAQPAPEYPETLPCPVLLEPGLRLGKGIKTSTMLAALARRAVHESDMAALSPEERAEFQARIEDFKALIAQPAPVVPEEATPDSIEILASGRCRDHVVYQWDEDQRNAAADSWNACRAAMLEADPQLPGSDSAPVPGSWIPVSERMPEDRTQVILWDAEIGEVTSGHYSHKTHTFYHCGDAIENEITHWMAPPAAPQEVKSES